MLLLQCYESIQCIFQYVYVYYCLDCNAFVIFSGMCVNLHIADGKYSVLTFTRGCLNVLLRV